MNSKHEITIYDITEAMKTKIVLASSCSSKVRKSKSLEFESFSLMYIVSFSSNGKPIIVEDFKHPYDALTRYNEHNV